MNLIKRKNYLHEYYLKNKESEDWKKQQTTYHKKWYQKNKEKKDAQNKKWHQENRKRSVEIVQNYVKKNKEKVLTYQKQYTQTAPALFRTTLYRAKKKGLEFTLSLEEFSKIVINPCIYCGENELRRGIDRVDNLIGYTKENSVACCKICNYMKNKYTKQDFLFHIKRIYQKQFIM